MAIWPFTGSYRAKYWYRNLYWNIRSIPWGLSNIIRYWRTVYSTGNGDWLYLAELMEMKLTELADGFKGSHVQDAEEIEAECREAASILRRLQEDRYVYMFGYDGTRGSMTEEVVRKANGAQDADVERLGELMKHMLHWWD